MPFDEAGVPRGFEVDVGLVAVDECGRGFSFEDEVGRAPVEGSFDIFTACFPFAMLTM